MEARLPDSRCCGRLSRFAPKRMPGERILLRSRSTSTHFPAGLPKCCRLTRLHIRKRAAMVSASTPTGKRTSEGDDASLICAFASRTKSSSVQVTPVRRRRQANATSRQSSRKARCCWSSRASCWERMKPLSSGSSPWTMTKHRTPRRSAHYSPRRRRRLECHRALLQPPPRPSGPLSGHPMQPDARVSYDACRGCPNWPGSRARATTSSGDEATKPITHST